MTGIRRVSQLGTTGESTYVDGSIVNADIAAGAAIAVSKLAPSSSSGQVLMGGASGAPTYITPSGDVTWDQSGVVAIGTGVIVNADINASAAIAQSKIANLASDLAAKAPLASPTFTGNASLSNGQIVTPYQYCYNGDNGTAAAVSFDSSTTVKPPNAYFNIGGCFNASNGRFTVPIAGYVLCSFNSLINRPLATSHAYVHFEVDGVRKSVRTHTVYDLGGNYNSLNNTAIVYCPANSYVTCVLGTSASATAYAGEWGLGLTFRYLG